MASGQSSKFNLQNENLFPQEERLEIAKKKRNFSIGIPKEEGLLENRVPLTPEAIEILVNNGNEVFVESKAGQRANYSDNDFSENGATIVQERAELFRQADIILKVAPFSLEELDLLKSNQLLFSSLYPGLNYPEYVRKLIHKKATAISFEKIKDESGTYPVVSSMSEISGIAAVHIAAELLSNEHGGKGVLLGGITGITPVEVIILGAGIAAEYAARVALGLGAYVKIFDNSLDKLRRIQNNLGQRLYTSLFHPQVLEKTLKSADVLIGAIHFDDEKEGPFISENLIASMKKGSVIVDLSVDQGGCIETSLIGYRKNPVFKKYGVIHFSSPNIPSRFARTASIALSNIFTPLLLDISEYGGILNYLKENTGIRNGVYLYQGILTSQKIGNMVGMSAKDINLLMAAF